MISSRQQMYMSEEYPPRNGCAWVVMIFLFIIGFVLVLI